MTFLEAVRDLHGEEFAEQVKRMPVAGQQRLHQHMLYVIECDAPPETETCFRPSEE